MNQNYFKIIEEICSEEQIRLNWVSNHWIAVLEHKQQRHFIAGYKFDLNSAASSLIADDKFATFEVLSYNGLPIIEHSLLYGIDNREPYAKDYQSLAYINRFLLSHDNDIVIKPNTGTQGLDIHHVHSLAEVKQAAQQIFKRYESASLCPFYNILTEYRIIMLDDIVVLMYAKSRGDDWRFNLQQGAQALKSIPESLRPKLTKIAKSVVKSLGLRFCSVDIIETSTHELLVMEVNSGVMIEHYITQHPEDYGLVKDIYRAAIKKMFSGAGEI